MHSLGNVDESLKAQLISDFKTADISEKDKLILAYVTKITKEPASIKKDDVTTLLENGFSQSAVHDIVQVASYFSYVNRMADALGIELENE